MNKLALLLVAGLLFLEFTTPVCAQSNVGSGSINVDKNGLEHVKPFKARRQYQIIDQNPEIHDTRPPLEQPNNLQINIPPRQVVPGKQYVYGDPASAGKGNTVQLAPEQNDLPQAGFTRYAPKQTRVNSDLPSGSSVPVVNPAAPAAASEKKAVNGHLNPAARPAPETRVLTYKKDYSHPGGASSGSNNVKTSATGKMVGKGGHTLLNQLKTP